MSALRLVDLHFGGREHSIGVYLLETADGLALCRTAGPASTLPRLVAGLREHGVELADVRHCCSRTSTSTTPARPGSLVRQHPELTVWVSEVGAPHLRRPVAARALRAPALRRDVRPALGGAAAGAGGERADRGRRRARLGGVPDRRPRVAPRLVLPRRDAARGRRVRRANRPVVVRASRSRRLPTSTSRPGTRRSPRSGGASRSGSRSSTSASTTDVAAHLDRLEAELDRWAARVALRHGRRRVRRRRPRGRRPTRPTSTTASRRSCSPGSGCAATGTSGSRRTPPEPAKRQLVRRMLPPDVCASAISRISSMFTCGGRVSANMTQSATSSAVSGPPIATVE